MIDHVICFKLPESAGSELREALKQRLSELAEIPGVVGFALGENFGHRARGFDINMRVTLETREDLDAYEAHPIHLDVVAYNRKITEEHICFDFEWQ